jgi:hypothetical protein
MVLRVLLLPCGGAAASQHVLIAFLMSEANTQML